VTGDPVYFVVSAPDAERAQAFFGAVLGWEFAEGNAPGGFHITNVSPPGGLAGGAPAAAPRLYFQVPDIRAAVAQVAELGGEAGELQPSQAGTYADCRDDQGVEFSLFQSPS
jgi:predicted enzyme related to lactoylglutathione lyase